MEAMTSKIILMMPKNQELSKFQRIRSQKASRIKFEDLRFKNNQVSTIKIQEQRVRFRISRVTASDKTFSNHFKLV